MFDEQEQKLLEQALVRARRDYRNNSNVYGISAFDENLDRELRKLVIHYSFDFEAIALHLYFKFPQYAYKLKPQAVSYRWYQLILQDEGERIKQEILSYNPKQGRITEQKMELVEIDQMAEDETEEVVLFDLEHKKLHYEAAMKMAAYLDEEEEEGFMVYKPKFIVDSEFKLEREKTENTLMMSALLDNGLSFQFGSFNAPQAAPIDLSILDWQEKAAPEAAEQQIEQQYMDDDWQAYESD